MRNRFNLSFSTGCECAAVARPSHATAAVAGSEVRHPSVSLVVPFNLRIQRACRSRLQLHRRSVVQGLDPAALALHHSHDSMQQGAPISQRMHIVNPLLQNSPAHVSQSNRSDLSLRLRSMMLASGVTVTPLAHAAALPTLQPADAIKLARDLEAVDASAFPQPPSSFPSPSCPCSSTTTTAACPYHFAECIHHVTPGSTSH